MIGNNRCLGLKVESDTKLTCTAPSGTGNVTVCGIIQVRGCFEASTFFQYDGMQFKKFEILILQGPQVESISPHNASTTGGPTMTVKGINFGFKAQDIRVFVGENECTDVNFLGKE